MKFWIKQYILFVILTYISRVNGEIVCKMMKNRNLKIQIYESNDISSCRAYNSKQDTVFF